VLLQLLLDEREGEFGADEGDVGAQVEEERDGADVVLVAVCEDERDHVVQAVTDHVQVGQDEVDTGVVVVREEDAAVHDEERAVQLHHRHVAADFA